MALLTELRSESWRQDYKSLDLDHRPNGERR
jgi:hypothetical protein